jgi:hypothetical protein
VVFHSAPGLVVVLADDVDRTTDLLEDSGEVLGVGLPSHCISSRRCLGRYLFASRIRVEN